MELEQAVFAIPRQSVDSTREPVPSRPELVGFYIRVFVVSAKKQIRESNTGMCYVFEFLLVYSMVFYDSSQLIHQTTGMEIFFDRLSLSLQFLDLKQ